MQLYTENGNRPVAMKREAALNTIFLLAANWICTSKLKFKWRGASSQVLVYNAGRFIERRTPSVWAVRADVCVVNGELAGVHGVPVSEEELLCLALQGLLAFSDHGARLVHHQAYASSLGEVVFRPVGRPCGHKHQCHMVSFGEGEPCGRLCSHIGPLWSQVFKMLWVIMS